MGGGELGVSGGRGGGDSQTSGKEKPSPSFSFS